MKISGGWLNIFASRITSGLFNSEHDALMNSEYHHDTPGYGRAVKTIYIPDFDTDNDLNVHSSGTV